MQEEVDYTCASRMRPSLAKVRLFRPDNGSSRQMHEKKNSVDSEMVENTNAIEQVIGHLKAENCLDGNRLKQAEGDRLNLVALGACGYFEALTKDKSRAKPFSLSQNPLRSATLTYQRR